MADTCLSGSIIIFGFVVAQQECFTWQVTLVEHHTSWLNCHVELMRCLSRQRGDSAVAPVSFTKKGRSQNNCSRSAHMGDTQQTIGVIYKNRGRSKLHAIKEDPE